MYAHKHYSHPVAGIKTYFPTGIDSWYSKQANKPFLIVSNFTGHNRGIKKTLAIPHLRGRKIVESKVCELNYEMTAFALPHS